MAPVLSSADQLKRLFAALTEQTFQVEYGVADPPLIDYLADMLVRFVRLDAVFKVRDVMGRRLEEVAEMLIEAEEREANPKREIHRHIGDFTLFWTGVYPEALKVLKRSELKDSLIDFSAQGKRAYYIASTIPADDQSAQPEVLGKLSTQFELCSFGLHEVRQEWERRDDGTADVPIIFN